MAESPPDQKRYFEDFEIGDTTTSTVARTVSEYDNYLICGLYGTFSDLHLNKPLMERTEWGGRLVPGVALTVLMLGLAGRLPWNPDSRALYGFDNVRFIKPVHIGDTVYLTAEILDKEQRDNEDRGVLRQKENLYVTEDGQKQDGELVVTRERLFMCGNRPADSD